MGALPLPRIFRHTKLGIWEEKEAEIRYTDTEEVAWVLEWSVPSSLNSGFPSFFGLGCPDF